MTLPRLKSATKENRNRAWVQNFAPGRIGFLLLCLTLAAQIFVPHRAHAAVGFIQQNQNHGCAGGTICSVSFRAKNTAGNLIVVAVDLENQTNSVNSIADSLGNTYISRIGPINFADNARIQIFSAHNVAAGTNTVTVTLSASDTIYYQVSIFEYSGIDTSSPFDVASSATGTGVTASSGAATINQANDLIFGFCAGLGGISSGGAGFTVRQQLSGSIAEDKTATSIGAYYVTASVPFNKWICQMATFKAAPPGIQINSRSDTLSDSRPSATSNHTFVFTVNNAINGSLSSVSGTLTFTFDSAFTLPAGMDCSDVDAATSVQFNFNYPGCVATATAWGFSATGSVITLVPPTNTGELVASGTQITIKIGSNATVGQQGAHWITNPSSPGTYTITVGGTFGGSGNILVSINSAVSVQVAVAESLAFTVSGVTAGSCTADDGATITAVDTSSVSVPFGTLFPANTFFFGCQDLVVSTNAGGGYSLTVQEQTLLRTLGGFTIPQTSCDGGACTLTTAAAWATPTNNGFGHTCTNQTNHDCAATYSSGNNFRPTANVAAGDTPQVIMSSSTPAIAMGRIKYRVSAGSQQPAGDYKTVITFTITPTY